MQTRLQDLATLHWVGDVDGHLCLIDQTRLPVEFVEVECRDVETLWEAIRVLRVRGRRRSGLPRPMAYAWEFRGRWAATAERDLARLDEVTRYLATSRPTAVNLFWALQRMQLTARSLPEGVSSAEIAGTLLAAARAIHEEDRQMCRAIGRHGAALLAAAQGVLTHCNAGGLATADYGTALAVIFAAVEGGQALRVFADETRPLLQGARLTAWELKQRGIPVTLICDNMAAQVMREGRVQAVVVGADRIAANGDTANKIGTYSVAVLAAAHEIPFYVAAPTSTFDLSIADGDRIPIEQRDAREVTCGFGRPTAPEGIEVYNPAFDVTPARLIRAIICERGVIEPVTRERIAAVLG